MTLVTLSSSVTVVNKTSETLAPYRETAPSGVLVVSEVPFIETRWWDNPVLHPIWSYASWVTMILDCHGCPAPRRWFNRFWQR